MALKLVFTEYFDITETKMEQHGALNICLNADLPLFIDPFLLFASDKKEYKIQHDKIVNHLISLKEIAKNDGDNANLSLFKFPEIKQNWLGLCKYGNNGKGLGVKFAKDIISAFNGFYSNFGSETVSDTSHIEKLTLVGSGVGKDFISDFSTNLMFEFLLEYTESFAKKYLKPHQIKTFSVRCVYDEDLMVWKPREFELPFFFLEENGDFILLTPMDILTKDEAFICHNDLVGNFRNVANSIGNYSLRESVNAYFQKTLPVLPKKKDIELAVSKTINQYPEILDYYIRKKELEKDKSKKISSEKLDQLKNELIKTLGDFTKIILEESEFFNTRPTSYDESLKRANYLKDVIENNDGYRVFYHKGKAIASEDTVQRIFRLTWYATPFDVNAEVNNGRGPADYKISHGSGDSTIVEFKLAKSTSLKKNLENQTVIYKKASKSINDIKVILCYTKFEIGKVNRILKKIDQEGAENIVIIDASPKVSASVAG
ncbi:hypothetical protein Q4575_12090 [Psychrosphaera sp. 1_MG-2023]|uniref:hypothetical protein n=1 Tax=Psychrosphaera sp. 1_MG-2023 TaxID=3062643 RepID=UPI0026E12F32|nr:hypothetical protein [Psychrosphaera sp. 1_MG-2023]MDO6720148.1 hypothetical protein [Psychrosphaera sp. 1_MG-2023]